MELISQESFPRWLKEGWTHPTLSPAASSKHSKIADTTSSGVHDSAADREELSS